MATLVASPTLPLKTALQVQNALSVLPCPPTNISLPNKTITSASTNQIQTSPITRTTSAPSHSQSAQQNGPRPPLTPVSATGSNTGPQAFLNVTQTAALTPPTTGTGGTTSVTFQQQSSAIATTFPAQSNCCKTLEEAYLYPLMPIDSDIDTRWEHRIQKPINEILDHKVQDRLGHCQELMYAAQRGLFHKRSRPKPTIVVSVATKADRDRVKKVCKKMPRLQKDIADCQLRLMVVIDRVKLRAVHQVTKPTPSTSTYITECTISTDEGGRCAEKLTLLEPSVVTGEHTCTLGGMIVINDKLYGLTAGHAFQPTHLESRQRRPSASSASDCSVDGWLEDARNPFVFADDEDDNESVLTHTSTADGSKSPAMSMASFKEYFPEALPSQLDDNTGEKCNPVRVGILSPLAPTVNPDQPKRIRRNCDWALVELPRTPCARQHQYPSVDGRAFFSVTRMAQKLDRVSGDVEVRFSRDSVTGGYLSPNSACYGIGPFLFDVKLVVLQRDLPRGCSGAWVVQGDTLCGYLIASRGDSRWAYMMPIQSVVEDIAQTLRVRSIRLTNLDDARLEAGSLNDILSSSQPESSKSAEAFTGISAHVAGAITPENTPREEQQYPSSGYKSPGAVAGPSRAPLPTRPILRNKEDSSFSVISSEARPVSQPNLHVQSPLDLEAQDSGKTLNTRAVSMPDEFKHEVVRALQVVAGYTCWPCLQILNHLKRPKEGSAREADQPVMAERKSYVLPMTYAPQTPAASSRESCALGPADGLSTAPTQAFDRPHHVAIQQVDPVRPSVTIPASAHVTSQRYPPTSSSPTAMDTYVQRHRTRRPVTLERGATTDMDSVTIDSIVLSLQSNDINSAWDPRSSSVPDVRLSSVGAGRSPIEGIPAADMFSTWALSPPPMAYSPRAVSAT